MIDLTPLDVRKKKEDFKRAVRGYDALQVDAFLDVVADRLEQLVREHGLLTDRLEGHERQLKTYQERERALNEALLAAQELREQARSQAERDAAVRLREAETHAEAILLDADQAIRHSQRRLEDLRLRRGQFLKSLRTMLERFEDYLELENTRLDTEPDDLGDLLERLQTDVTDPPAAAAPSSPVSGDASVDAAAVDAASVDAGPADVGPVNVDLAAPPATGQSGSVVDRLDVDESRATAEPEAARNGDSAGEAARAPAEEAPAQGATVPAPDADPRIAPSSIAPADAGGSGAASS